MEFPLTNHASSVTTTTSSSGQNALPSKITFAPFGHGDTFDQCAAHNLAMNKTPIPILPKDRKTEHELMQSKQERITYYAARKTSIDENVAKANESLATNKRDQDVLDNLRASSPEQQKEFDEIGNSLADSKRTFTAAVQNGAKSSAKWGAYLKAAARTEILPPQRSLSNLPLKATVYLPGHGSANSSTVSTTQDASAQEWLLTTVAKDLKQAGLRQDTRVKLSSCHSADTEARATFLNDPPATTSGGFFETRKTAPAKTLADALDQPVIGYQGSRLRNGRLTHGHTMQINEKGEIARSSQVRKEFQPEPPSKSLFDKFF